MKTSSFRRTRRKRSSTHEGNFFKKESNHEPTFFGGNMHAGFFPPSANIQRKCDKCEEEDTKAHRQPDKEEDEAEVMAMTEKKDEDKMLQKKDGGNNAVTPAANSYVSSLNGSGFALPAHAKQFFSSRMGYNFSGVKIHTNNAAAQSAKSINAKAYTTGNHIVFNDGQFNTNTNEGKKLLAHELAHVMQQDEQRVSRKEDEVKCNEELNLEGLTDAVYNKGAGTMIGEKKKPSEGCDDCEDDCVAVTGTLKVPYKVDTTVTLPSVPDDLRPCQQQRVSAGIKNKLAPHEQKHVAAFKTFDGTAMLPVNYKGCEGGYTSYQESLAEAEFERRKGIADAKSAKLDPFSVDVDLCCKDTKPAKK